ncbi:hypothetical protein RCL1_008375 [Eukaryota sp. TZLM3-RCL]
MSSFALASSDCWALLSHICSIYGDSTLGASCLEQALRENQSNIPKMHCLASSVRHYRQLDTLVELLQRFLLPPEDDEPPYLNETIALASLFVLLDDFPNALTAYSKALELSCSNNPSLWFCVGLLMKRLNDTEGAFKAFSSCIALVGNSPFDDLPIVYLELSHLAQQKGNVDETLSFLDKVIELTDDHLIKSEAWSNKGFAHELAHNSTAAVDCLRKALEFNPNNCLAAQHLGWLYHNEPYSDSSTALTVLLRAASIDYRDEQTWYLLGRIYTKLNDWEKAFKCYQQSLVKDPNNPAIWASLGVLYYNSLQFKDSLAAYSRAISIAPTLAEIWFDIGKLYQTVGQWGDALNSFKAAADLHPRNEILVKIIADLKVKISDERDQSLSTTPPSTETTSLLGFNSIISPDLGIAKPRRNSVFALGPSVESDTKEEPPIKKIKIEEESS